MSRFLIFLFSINYVLLFAQQKPVLLKNINPTGNSDAYGYTCLPNGNIVFAATDPTNGTELWVTNGSEAGTVLLKDINAGSVSSSPNQFKAFNGKIYFAANNGVSGVELWITDGTTIGTLMLKDIYPGATSSNPFIIGGLGNKLYFGADDGVTGKELWATDGTNAGTLLFNDINVGPINTFFVSSESAVYDNKMYFSAPSNFFENELYYTNGTTSGTGLLKNINPYTNKASNPRNYVLFDNKLVFIADTGNSSTPEQKIWYTNGTELGTQCLLPNKIDVANLFPYFGELYFTAWSTVVGGRGLYKSDGTDAGTILVDADLFNPKWLTLFRNKLYMSASGRVISYAPFTTPTKMQFFMPSNPFSFLVHSNADKLYVIGTDGSGNEQLFVLNDENSNPIEIKPDISPNPDPFGFIDNSVQALSECANLLIYTASYAYDNEPYVIRLNPSSIKETEFKQTFTIYPNPLNSNFLNITLSESNELLIIDMHGNSVINTFLKEGVNQINISTLESGIYIAKAGDNIRKLIKE